MKKFFYLLVKSLNPFNYKELITRKKRVTFGYFFSLLLFAVLLNGIFNIPNYVNFPEEVESRFSKITKFNITNIDIEIEEPVVLLNKPKIVLDLSDRENITDEFILVTETNVFIKKVKPSLFGFKFYETEQKPVTEYSDLAQDFNMIKDISWVLLVFLIPSILFFIYVLYFVKYGVLILLFTLITYLVVLFSKKKHKLMQVFKVAVFSITIMVLLDIISPLFNLGILPFLVYIVFFIVSLNLCKHEKI